MGSLAASRPTVAVWGSALPLRPPPLQSCTWCCCRGLLAPSPVGEQKLTKRRPWLPGVWVKRRGQESDPLLSCFVKEASNGAVCVCANPRSENKRTRILSQSASQGQREGLGDLGQLAWAPPAQLQWGAGEGVGTQWLAAQDARSGLSQLCAGQLLSFLSPLFLFFGWGGYLLYRKWCLDVMSWSPSLSENKLETVACVLLLCQPGVEGTGGLLLLCPDYWMARLPLGIN